MIILYIISKFNYFFMQLFTEHYSLLYFVLSSFLRFFFIRCFVLFSLLFEIIVFIHNRNQLDIASFAGFFLVIFVFNNDIEWSIKLIFSFKFRSKCRMKENKFFLFFIFLRLENKYNNFVVVINIRNFKQMKKSFSIYITVIF